MLPSVATTTPQKLSLLRPLPEPQSSPLERTVPSRWRPKRFDQSCEASYSDLLVDELIDSVVFL
eukprot:1643380-Pleurochrysis_carterae.AAC.5